MSAAELPCPDLPPPEPPSSDQPGGFGFFVRVELWWGKVRRALLRRFFPGHVAFWLSRRRGDCEKYGRDVIDPRDLKFFRSVAGCWFDPEDDAYRRRFEMGFARYGYAELVGFSVILIGVISFLGSVLAVLFSPWFLLLSAASTVIWLEVFWFFRDPERIIPTDPHSVLSPADGTVTHVETVDEPDFGPNTLRISIFLSIFNVHGNRAPRDATVERVLYFRGRFLDARHPECGARNEQLWLDLKDHVTGRKVRVKQIAGAIARRIVCWLRVDESVKAGDRYGMIKFGSRTELLIPADTVAQTLVKVGDKVRGGVSVLAKTK